MLTHILHILAHLSKIITVNFSTFILAINIWGSGKSFWNIIVLIKSVLNVTSMHIFSIGIIEMQHIIFYFMCWFLVNILDRSKLCVLMHFWTLVSHMNNGAKSSGLFFLDHKVSELTINYSVMLKRSNFINIIKHL